MSSHPYRPLVASLALIAGVTVVIAGCGSSSADNSALLGANYAQQQNQLALLAAQQTQASWEAGGAGSYSGTYSISNPRSFAAAGGTGMGSSFSLLHGGMAQVLGSSLLAAPTNTTVAFTLRYVRRGNTFTYLDYTDDYGLSGTGTGTLTQGGDFAVTITVTLDSQGSQGTIVLTGKFANPLPGAGKDLGELSVSADVTSTNTLKRLTGTGLGKLKVPAAADPLATVLNAAGDPSKEADLPGSNRPTPVTATFSSRSLAYVNGYPSGSWSTWSTPSASTYTFGLESYVIPTGYTPGATATRYSPNDVYAGRTVARSVMTSSFMPGFTSAVGSYLTKGTDGIWYMLGSDVRTYTAGGVTESYFWYTPPTAMGPSSIPAGSTVTVTNSKMPVAGGTPGTTTTTTWTTLEANSSATFPSADFALPAGAPSLANPCFKSKTQYTTEVATVTKASDGKETTTSTKSGARHTTYMQSAAAANTLYGADSIYEMESLDKNGTITGKTQGWTTVR